MFHPMAFTVVAALVGAMIQAVTFIPPTVALFIADKLGEKENRLMMWSQRGYRPTLEWAPHNKPLILTITAVSIVVGDRL